MADKIFTVAILGCGGRGAETYGKLMAKQSGQYKIVALCDILPEKLNKYGEILKVPAVNRFSSEQTFFEQKRADLLIIATLDAMHTQQCLHGLALGYDILLEKPITDKIDDCRRLLQAQKKSGRKVLVCHVLRYGGAFKKLAELLDGGAVGRLTSIEALEQVGYWHQAHSYVRGNWRRIEDTTPMILAKCCHDLDLLQYYAKSKCKSLSSVGGLTYFKADNAPEGAAKRCWACKYVDSCAYSAKKIYIDRWKQFGSPADWWPYNILTLAYPLTEETLTEAVKTGPYGRCVFACDNDAVDHQLTVMTFDNGVKASLTMTAFTPVLGRIMKFFGSEGEIELDESRNMIAVTRFGQESQTIALDTLIDNGYGHGGGDYGLMNELYEVLLGNATPETSLEYSLESHLMGIYAEQSRLSGGKLVYIHGDEPVEKGA